jgi:guanine deaminase
MKPSPERPLSYRHHIIRNRVPEVGDRFPSDAALMAATIRLARQNVDHGGGPFAAAIVTPDRRVVGVGCNEVVHANDPSAHAEISAIRDACKRLQRFNLDATFALFTTCMPCVMCSGAVHLSGVGRLVCAARHDDTFEAGLPHKGLFDFVQREYLEKRMVIVEEDLLRDEVIQVFSLYLKRGGTVYLPEKQSNKKRERRVG